MSPLVVQFVMMCLLIGGIMTAAAYLVLVERWMAAWVQLRRGPNRVGIPLTKIRLFGLGQPLADGLKFIFKEEYVPAHVDRVLYVLAPVAILASALAVFAVIPFGGAIPPLPSLGIDQPIPMVIAPGLDVGMLYIFALSSVAVYGVILGGWASDNKYSFLGALRSSAQLIAYELPLGLGILGIVLATGSLKPVAIIHHQAESGIWFAMSQPLGMMVFVVAAFAEAARLPFDLPEAEQELIGGYHTEYSGMKLLLFLTAEFIHMLTASVLIVILFLGGWHLWGVTGSPDEVSWTAMVLRSGVLGAKCFAVVLFFMLVRWTWPRFRFDQLMTLAWKVMLPLGMVNLVVVAILAEYGGNLSTGTVIFLGWTVAGAAWLTAATLTPLISDNRPRR